MEELVQTILEQFTLSRTGVHGITHWARVLENGRLLAGSTGADPRVVTLFAVFHDSKRVNDGRDDGHGLRGAEYAKELLGTGYDLTDDQFDLLYTACAAHTDGLTEGNVTVQTCWDADRLDLLRVGVRPSPKLLCTPIARTKKIIAASSVQAKSRFVSPLIRSEWGVDLKKRG